MKLINQGKTNWKFLLIVIILSIIVAFLALIKNDNVSTTQLPEPVQEKTIVKKTTVKKTETVAEKSLAYTDALNLYVNRRIQFDPNCLATPNYVVFTKGTEIMLDNRSEQIRPIFLDGQKYTLGPYGFKIVTITTSNILPHTMHVDCGNGKNNAQIIIQQ